jgi:hypothetical protein
MKAGVALEQIQVECSRLALSAYVNDQNTLRGPDSPRFTIDDIFIPPPGSIFLPVEFQWKLARAVGKAQNAAQFSTIFTWKSFLETGVPSQWRYLNTHGAVFYTFLRGIVDGVCALHKQRFPERYVKKRGSEDPSSSNPITPRQDGTTSVVPRLVSKDGDDRVALQAARAFQSRAAHRERVYGQAAIPRISSAMLVTTPVPVDRPSAASERFDTEGVQEIAHTEIQLPHKLEYVCEFLSTRRRGPASSRRARVGRRIERVGRRRRRREHHKRRGWRRGVTRNIRRQQASRRLCWYTRHGEASRAGGWPAGRIEGGR